MARGRVPPPSHGSAPDAAETASPDPPALEGGPDQTSPSPTESAAGTGGPEGEPRPVPEEVSREIVAKGRARRQAVLHRRRRSRLSESQQWIFVALAIAFALAWILGRDACTQTISKTYGTIDARSGSDAGAVAPRRHAPPLPAKDAGPGDDW